MRRSAIMVIALGLAALGLVACSEDDMPAAPTPPLLNQGAGPSFKPPQNNAQLPGTMPSPTAPAITASPSAPTIGAGDGTAQNLPPKPVIDPNITLSKPLASSALLYLLKTDPPPKEAASNTDTASSTTTPKQEQPVAAPSAKSPTFELGKITFALSYGGEGGGGWGGVEKPVCVKDQLEVPLRMIKAIGVSFPIEWDGKKFINNLRFTCASPLEITANKSSQGNWINSNKAWEASAINLPAVFNSFGEQNPLVLTGIIPATAKYKDSTVVDEITFRFQAISPEGKLGEPVYTEVERKNASFILTHPKDTAGLSGQPLLCPAGSVATNASGHSGEALDSFGIICREITTSSKKG